MPHEPLVCAIMLTKDRPEMAARAVRAFRAQTYDPVRRVLMILDTGAERSFVLSGSDSENEAHDWRPSARHMTVGGLRNLSATWAPESSILIHWDDDDYSHPNRIAEQVAHLQSSGADAVGYNELLFWRTRVMIDDRAMPDAYGEAWLYKTASIFPPPGTSLCYWRKTWERKPFPDLPKGKGGTGEDHAWCKGLKVATTSSVIMDTLSAKDFLTQPRMIASIHGGNTMPYDLEAQLERGAGTNWKRVPQLDEYCRERMAL